MALRDVDAAVAFYKQAFGAVEEGDRIRSADGLQVAVLSIAGHRFGLATERPTLAHRARRRLATTVRISLEVDDPDAVAKQAIAAGGGEMFAVADQPYGMRQGPVRPLGHHWLIGRRL